ncbi:MAG: VapC toxin family PIN domain ribonuclease [Verrucomicrobia bacterium]|jgi:predicted nucleic acid-binding protein|nr:VapC toxin family PIN domain ribonuclease [Verrucomicrobiota bacterium]
MIGFDANILLYAYAEAAPEHRAAQDFLAGYSGRSDVVISEFTLTELYLLLRNPAVLKKPLSAAKAVDVIEAYRKHPKWRIPGFPPASRQLHDQLWTHARRHQFARRRLYDVRTALTLIAFGVTDFATANVKDFRNLGFERAWNPLH